MREIRVRFAPSPTGLIHVGNARTALLNFLFARKEHGVFLLRIDDTDMSRSTKAFEEAIARDLAWLGLEHTEIAHQSLRMAKYVAAFEKLKAEERVYPCYETEAELERKRALQVARKQPPIYDRASLDPANIARWQAQGRKPHWRFLLSRQKAKWCDLVRGPVEIDTATQSDPVLLREDGAFLYTFPSVVDDVELGITHVVRGEDHVTNTAAQIEIFQALGAQLPTFAHFPLLVGAGGEALSKRLGSLSLAWLREEGLEPIALASYLAKIGTSDPVEPCLSLDDLARSFDFAKVGRAPAHFDVSELKALNARTLHIMPFEAVAARMDPKSRALGELFWNTVRPNLSRFEDVKDMARLVLGPISPVIENREFAAKAAQALPSEPWNETTWQDWTKALSQQTGAKGKELFHPLRLALTGKEHGPELKKLLPLIGRDRSLARLKGQTA